MAGLEIELAAAIDDIADMHALAVAHSKGKLSCLNASSHHSSSVMCTTPPHVCKP